jgi:hypothetical protein
MSGVRLNTKNGDRVLMRVVALRVIAGPGHRQHLTRIEQRLYL